MASSPIRKAGPASSLMLLAGLAVGPPVLAGSEARGRAETWYAGSRCGGAEAGAKVLASRADYRRFRERRSLQGAPGFPREGRWLLVLSMGRQPTAGYRLTLAGTEIRFVPGDEARIRVRWHEPDPARIRAQGVTRPCLLAALLPLEVKRLRVRTHSREEAPSSWTVRPPECRREWHRY